MSPVRPQLTRPPRAPRPAPLRGRLAGLLAAALPGALLLCILHCSLPSYAHQGHGHDVALFVCDHGLARPGDLPSPLSATLLHGLVQGLLGPGAPLVAGLVFLHLAAPSGRNLRTRPGDGPPVPPPRPAA